MESGGSTDIGLKGKGKKTERNRRAWTPIEKTVLADLMKDLVSNGWRTENGFKPGYLLKLQAGIAERLPGTDIRATPHITSRLTIRKKAHASLLTMLNDNSGIGFNTTNGMIDCHDDAWDLIVKADPSATNMRYKAWPLYEDWNEIFGKDRANGGTAEDVMQAVNTLVNDDPIEVVANNNIPSDLEREDGPVDMEVNSEAPRVQRTVSNKNSGKKRSCVESPSTEKFCDVLRQMNKSYDIRMDKLCRAIGYDADLEKAKSDLFNLLDELPELSEDDKVDAAHYLAKSTECLNLFVRMPKESRARYVRRLLGGQLHI